MGIVLAGTAFSHIGVLTSMGVHFVLGSGAIGNAMLPLLEINKENAGDRPENLDADTPSTAAGPAVQAQDGPVEASPASAKAQ
jgi:hypothetical protein